MAVNEFILGRLVNGVVLPPLPPYPAAGKDRIEAYGKDYPDFGLMAPERVEQTQFATPQVMPLRMKLSRQVGKLWLLPCEPLITIGYKNVLVKRSVAKGRHRGTIKERWAQDDYSIAINGLFTKHDTYEYPDRDLKQLKEICEARDTVDVVCPLFEMLGISRIVIESYDLPFTKGEENQNWSITAVSDDDWDLLLKTGA